MFPFLSRSVLPMFFSKSLIVSTFTFQSLIYFEFIFMYGVRECSYFVLSHVAVQFSRHHLLERLFFFIAYSCLHCHSLGDQKRIVHHEQMGFIPEMQDSSVSVQFCHSVMSDSLQPHGLQHPRLPCSLPTPGA